MGNVWRRQRLVVHRFVLEDREDRFRAIEQWMAWTLQICPAQRVEHAAIRLLGERVHLVAGRLPRAM